MMLSGANFGCLFFSEQAEETARPAGQQTNQEIQRV
jgi:hypothetical protein